MQSLLYETHYKLKNNDKIQIRIPTVEEIIAREDEYYNLIYILTAMPIDFMVQLDNAGIDFTTIDDYELFLRLFPVIQQTDTSLIFGDLDLAGFNIGVSETDNKIVLINTRNEIEINQSVQREIAGVLRRLHNLKKNSKKPANQDAKDFMLERARAKTKRKKRESNSELEPLIISLVNTPEFKYNFDEVKKLTIYQFNESAKQIIKKIDYNNKMFGVYSGSISVKDLKKDDLNWLTR